LESECPFCARSKIEDRLVGETRNNLIIATRGQISEGGHLLVMPKAHVRCIGELSAEEVKIFTLQLGFVREILMHEYLCSHILVFEHGMAGQTVPHAHVHLLPATIRLTERIQADFPDKKIETIHSIADVQYEYKLHKQLYIFWQDGDGARVLWNAMVSKQYLRTITAEALKRPERADWRAMDQTLDNKLCESTLQRLRKYF
jgi:diadenosine tetraphosphate (Ap4A) HIT family hydrolase